MRPGSIVDGKYVIEREVGAGGMGQVFFARRCSDQKPVALKVLLELEPPGSSRFEREVAALRALQHPAIVRYVDHGLVDGHSYLVMDWVEGQSLLDRLAGRGLTVAEAVALSIRLAEALAHAHAHGLLHRDLKPGNLIVGGDDPTHITIIDFGIARRMRDVQKLTQTGQVVGSPGYLSPEQASGATQLDERADVFAQGCLLYECLTGRQPFPGTNVVAVLAKVLMSEPSSMVDLVPGMPPALYELVESMLAKDPDRRPANAAVVAERLRNLPPLPSTPRRQVGSLHDVETGAVGKVAAPAETNHALGATRAVTTATSFVIAARVEDGELFTEASEREADERQLLHRVAAPFGARVHQMADHSFVAVVIGRDQQEVVERAADCALAMRGVLGQTPMMQSVTPNRAGLAAAIDAAAAALQTDALGALFADGDAAAIRVDAQCAAHLDAHFELRTDDSGSYLVKRR